MKAAINHKLRVKWTVPSFAPGKSLEYCGEVIFIYRKWWQEETWLVIALDHGSIKEMKASDVCVDSN